MFEINIDTDSMNRSEYNITGQIFISSLGYNFPEKKWDDFVVIILNWWLKNVRNYLNNETDECVLNFMDGPYCINLSMVVDNTDYCIVSYYKNYTGTNRILLTSQTHLLSDVTTAFKLASNKVLRECLSRKWKDETVNKLTQNYNLYIAMLKNF